MAKKNLFFGNTTPSLFVLEKKNHTSTPVKKNTGKKTFTLKSDFNHFLMLTIILIFFRFLCFFCSKKIYFRVKVHFTDSYYFQFWESH